MPDEGERHRAYDINWRPNLPWCRGHWHSQETSEGAQQYGTIGFVQRWEIRQETQWAECILALYAVREDGHGVSSLRYDFSSALVEFKQPRTMLPVPPE